MTLANILWPSVCQIRQSQPRHSAPVTASIVWYVIHCTRLDDVQPDWQTAMCLPCQPSSVTILTCCIPQYSVLGPIYTADILTIVAKHGLHDWSSHADDSQVCGFCHPDFTDVQHLRSVSMTRISDITTGWNAIHCSSIHQRQSFSGARPHIERTN